MKKFLSSVSSSVRSPGHGGTQKGPKLPDYYFREHQELHCKISYFLR